MTPFSPAGRTPTASGLDALLDFLRFASVSSDPARRGDVRRCAAWLAGHLRRIGLPFVRVVPTAGHPIVYAEAVGRPDRPTVLLYGHYDVQPPGPLGRWTTPPFAPAVRGDAVYARGATDDKGPLFAHLAAIAGLLRRGRLPVNVKLLLEGEEEIGSPNLGGFVARHRRRLAADAAVISDTRMAGPDRPAIVYGQRGSLYLEVTARGPPRALHVGEFGGAVRNPADVLCGLLAGLHDPTGRVAVPGFYADVRPAGGAERRRLARDGPGDARLHGDAGVGTGWGEPGFTAYERTVLRPAVVVTGVAAGGVGAGGVSAIPDRAAARVNVRLVPGQDPGRVAALLRRHFAARVPPGGRVAVAVRSATRPVLIDPDHPALRAGAAALRHAFGTAPAFLRSGGTIPVVSLLQDVLRVPVVMMGFARPDDRAHGADEKFHLSNLARGTAAAARFLELAASLPPNRTPP